MYALDLGQSPAKGTVFFFVYDIFQTLYILFIIRLKQSPIITSQFNQMTTFDFHVKTCLDDCAKMITDLQCKSCTGVLNATANCKEQCRRELADSFGFQFSGSTDAPTLHFCYCRGVCLVFRTFICIILKILERLTRKVTEVKTITSIKQ